MKILRKSSYWGYFNQKKRNVYCLLILNYPGYWALKVTPGWCPRTVVARCVYMAYILNSLQQTDAFTIKVFHAYNLRIRTIILTLIIITSKTCIYWKQINKCLLSEYFVDSKVWMKLKHNKPITSPHFQPLPKEMFGAGMSSFFRHMTIILTNYLLVL